MDYNTQSSANTPNGIGTDEAAALKMDQEDIANYGIRLSLLGDIAKAAFAYRTETTLTYLLNPFSNFYNHIKTYNLTAFEAEILLGIFAHAKARLEYRTSRSIHNTSLSNKASDNWKSAGWFINGVKSFLPSAGPAITDLSEKTLSSRQSKLLHRDRVLLAEVLNVMPELSDLQQIWNATIQTYIKELCAYSQFNTEIDIETFLQCLDSDPNQKGDAVATVTNTLAPIDTVTSGSVKRSLTRLGDQPGDDIESQNGSTNGLSGGVSHEKLDKGFSLLENTKKQNVLSLYNTTKFAIGGKKVNRPSECDPHIQSQVDSYVRVEKLPASFNQSLETLHKETLFCYDRFCKWIGGGEELSLLRYKKIEGDPDANFSMAEYNPFNTQTAYLTQNAPAWLELAQIPITGEIGVKTYATSDESEIQLRGLLQASDECLIKFDKESGELVCTESVMNFVLLVLQEFHILHLRKQEVDKSRVQVVVTNGPTSLSVHSGIKQRLDECEDELKDMHLQLSSERVKYLFDQLTANHGYSGIAGIKRHDLSEIATRVYMLQKTNDSENESGSNGAGKSQLTADSTPSYEILTLKKPSLELPVLFYSVEYALLSPFDRFVFTKALQFYRRLAHQQSEPVYRNRPKLFHLPTNTQAYSIKSKWFRVSLVNQKQQTSASSILDPPHPQQLQADQCCHHEAMYLANLYPSLFYKLLYRLSIVYFELEVTGNGLVDFLSCSSVRSNPKGLSELSLLNARFFGSFEQPKSDPHSSAQAPAPPTHSVPTLTTAPTKSTPGYPKRSTSPKYLPNHTSQNGVAEEKKATKLAAPNNAKIPSDEDRSAICSRIRTNVANHKDKRKIVFGTYKDGAKTTILGYTSNPLVDNFVTSQWVIK